MESIGDLAVTKLEAAGWTVHLVPNASIADLEAAFTAYPHIQGLWIHSHGNGQGWIGLAKTSGVFSSPVQPFTPTDLVSALGLNGQYWVRKIAVMACDQNIADWQSAIGADEAFSPLSATLFHGRMEARKEYNSIAAGHSIFTPIFGSPKAPSRAPAASQHAAHGIGQGLHMPAIGLSAPASPRSVGATPPPSACVTDEAPFPDYDFMIDLDTLDMPSDPWAPLACATASVPAGIPATVSPPDGLWSVQGWSHGPVGSSIPLDVTCWPRIPDLWPVTAPPWRILVTHIGTGDGATMDSMRVTIRWLPGELLDYVNGAEIVMYWILDGPLPFLLAVPTVVDLIDRSATATVYGPGTLMLGVRVTTGVATDRAGSASRPLSMSPNPAGRNVTLGFSQPRAGAVEIGLYTLQGERVLRHVNSAAGAGELKLDLSLPAGIAPGVYLVRVVGGGVQASSKLTVVR